MKAIDLSHKVAGIVVLFYLCFAVHAALASDTDVCVALFKDGVIDKEDTFSDKQKYQQIKSMISSSSLDTYSKAESARNSLGIDVFDVLDVAFGGQTDASNYQQRRSDFLQKDFSELFSNSTLRVSVRKASSVATAAAVSCIDKTANINGFKAWIVPSKGMQAFTVNTRYVNVGGNSDYTINSLSISPDVGARCDMKTPIKVRTMQVAIPCQKPANATVQVSLNSTAGSLPGIDVGGYDDLVRDVGDRLAAIEAGGMLVPKGAVSYFNLSECPSGWRAVARAEGRYIVGLAPGGHLAEMQGLALKDLENRPTGNHTHKLGGFVPKNYFRTGGGNRDFYPDSAETRGPTVPAGMTTADGTNAPYVQFLACERT